MGNKDPSGAAKTRPNAQMPQIQALPRSFGTPELHLALSKHPLSHSFGAQKTLFHARLDPENPPFALVWRSKTPLGARKTLFRVRLALKKTTWRYQNHSRLMACRFSPKTTSARTQNNDLRHGQSPEGGRWNADGGWRMAEGGRRLRKRAPKGSRTGPLACRPKREAPLGAGV